MGDKASLGDEIYLNNLIAEIAKETMDGGSDEDGEIQQVMTGQE